MLLLFGCVEVVDEPNTYGFCYEPNTAICFNDSNKEWEWVCDSQGLDFCNKGVRLVKE